MMRMMKRLLLNKTLMMVSFLVLFVVQMSFAQFGGGAGTAGSPYRLSTLAHLEELADSVNNYNAYSGAHFVLTQDIDASATGVLNNPSNNGGTGFTPIGINGHFSGHLDGCGFAVKDLSKSLQEGLWQFVQAHRKCYD